MESSPTLFAPEQAEAAQLRAQRRLGARIAVDARQCDAADPDDENADAAANPATDDNPTTAGNDPVDRFTLRCFNSTESGEGCRIATALANQVLPSGLEPGQILRGRLPVTQIFGTCYSYADPLQLNEDGLPTREQLYAVRFIDSAPDQQGMTVRVPLVFEIDQQTGELIPLAQIQRSIVTDEFETLEQWTVVDSRVQPNIWRTGTLGEAESAAYVGRIGDRSNNYQPGTAAQPSVLHLWRDISFPIDATEGQLHLVMRILGQANEALPTDPGQDFASFHLIDPSIQPSADVPLPFETRLEGTLLWNRVDGTNGFVREQLVLRTPSIAERNESLAGATKRLVVSFQAGSGQGVLPMALALDSLMVVVNVVPPPQERIKVINCRR
jgi:hypothetical protein